MKNLDDGTIDPNIKFLMDTIRSGTPLILNGGSSEIGDSSQTYIVQWNGIIQHFESGILAMIGTASKYGLSQACAELDVEIMSAINTYHLIYNVDNKLSLYDLIYELHKSKYPSNTWDNWKRVIKTVENDINDLIENDDKGLLFQVSPYLSAVNALKNAHVDKTISSAIFVLESKFCKNCHDVPFNTLSKFFKQDKDHPIYIDITDLSFDDYMTEYIKTHKNLKNHIIITDNGNFIWKTIENPKIAGVSILMPYNPTKNLTDELAETANKTKLENEYIVYTNKPLTL